MYAGEEIECIITFKNIAKVPGEEKEQERPNAVISNGHPRDERRQSYVSAATETQSRRSSIVQGKAPGGITPSAPGTKGAQQGRGHRPTLSLNVVNNPYKAGPQTAPVQPVAPNSAVKSHGRSLSIMSLGSDRTTSEGRGPPSGTASKRPTKAHGRSASLQSVPVVRAQGSPHSGFMLSRQPSPLYESTTPPALAEEPLPLRPERRRPGSISAGNTPHLGRQNTLPKVMPSGALNQSFQFPQSQGKPKSPSPTQLGRPKPQRTPSNMHSGQQRAFSPRPPEGWSGALSSLNPISRVMSETSTAGTPRSSSEFYSMSNHSDETVTSELPNQSQPNNRFQSKPSHARQVSTKHRNHAGALEPEMLMMGYAQTMGYFTIDGSLVNAAPFEEVKRKGMQSGGGVIGIERSKRASGMFGTFSWSNIGESLGGLLGGDDMSSMAQMKATVGSKSIPLLSTPQNLLFVDLELGPGETKSYNYRFALPRGLPPSHKGRAIKVSYYLALGVQRPQGQAVKHVQIPFRILGSYNARGETLGHDLMSPYILLRDTAKSTNISPDPTTPSGFPPFLPKDAVERAKTPKQGLEDFLRYTERLLEQSGNSAANNDALLSPTSPSITREQSLDDQAQGSVKDAVDSAILRANHSPNTQSDNQTENLSANRFKIARAGQPVAVLTLLRPAYRLGEAVVGTVDFTAPPLESGLPPPSTTFSIVAELESAETVDSSLALRSSNSINRVTRKVHAAVRENTLFARQVSFNLAIPSTATPTFETSGVSLVWKLRVEFTTQRPGQSVGLGLDAAQLDHEDDSELLEEVGSDERGITLIAKEKLTGDTFEIAVPLKVYGAPGLEAVGLECESLEV